MEFSIFAFGYFFGSIPFGYIVSKTFFKKDIREYYSKNIGATNISRVFGLKVGIIVFILDFLKSYIPTTLIYFHYGGFISNLNYPVQNAMSYSIISGCGAIFGHLNPYILDFKGGKGVATFFGTISALNLMIGIIGGAIWLLLFLPLRISAISSLAAIAFITIGLFIGYPFSITIPLKAKIIIVITSCAIFLKHTENILRLIKKEEFKI